MPRGTSAKQRVGVAAARTGRAIASQEPGAAHFLSPEPELELRAATRAPPTALPADVLKRYVSASTQQQVKKRGAKEAKQRLFSRAKELSDRAETCARASATKANTAKELLNRLATEIQHAKEYRKQADLLAKRREEAGKVALSHVKGEGIRVKILYAHATMRFMKQSLIQAERHLKLYHNGKKKKDASFNEQFVVVKTLRRKLGLPADVGSDHDMKMLSMASEILNWGAEPALRIDKDLRLVLGSDVIGTHDTRPAEGGRFPNTALSPPRVSVCSDFVLVFICRGPAPITGVKRVTFGSKTDDIGRAASMIGIKPIQCFCIELKEPVAEFGDTLDFACKSVIQVGFLLTALQVLNGAWHRAALQLGLACAMRHSFRNTLVDVGLTAGGPCVSGGNLLWSVARMRLRRYALRTRGHCR